MDQNKKKRHTYQSGIIGNCAFIAHIAEDSNVSWLCWPHFDSSFVFGSLLDTELGGEFSIKPTHDFLTTQYYIENTNVLCTEITAADGRYRITDFAPRYRKDSKYHRPLTMMRMIEPLEGTPHIRISCRARGDYGKEAFQPEVNGSSIHYRYEEELLTLDTSIPADLIVEEQSFVLDQKVYLALHYGEGCVGSLMEIAEHDRQATIGYWRNWIKHATISPFAQQLVIRSALVLKIHQLQDTGAIIAASTTSLPEYPGSGRNWDYRYCWLRDSYYVLTALIHIGQFEEMEAYSNYINRIVQLN